MSQRQALQFMLSLAGRNPGLGEAITVTCGDPMRAMVGRVTGDRL